MAVLKADPKVDSKAAMMADPWAGERVALWAASRVDQSAGSLVVEKADPKVEWWAD